MNSVMIIAIDGVWYSKADLLLKAHSFADIELPAFRKSFWSFIIEWFNERDFVELKTSGSTGISKNIVVEKLKMQASAQRTISYLGLKKNSSALICLSCEYVAGKMMVVRALEACMNIVLVEPSSTPLKNITADFDFTAMVPLQILSYREDSAILNRVKTIIVGGALVKPDVISVLNGCDAVAYETYGMTETVSHIALRRINGSEAQSCFTALEGVSISCDGRGALMIEDRFTLDNMLITNDLCNIVSANEFVILGRIDNVINSGGIKISPEMIEKQIAEYIDVEFAASWIADERLGQKMVLVTAKPILENIFALLNSKLDKFSRFTTRLVIDELPKTPNNKIDRNALCAIIQAIE